MVPKSHEQGESGNTVKVESETILTVSTTE